MIIEESPILKEISKKQYDKAYHKYVKHPGDVFEEFVFACDFVKRPIYEPFCGIIKQINGDGIIGYKYYKNTHRLERTLLCGTSEIPTIKQLELKI